jgi:hypothetical protein
LPGFGSAEDDAAVERDRQGLDELARHIQRGSVVTVQEYAAQLWPQPTAGGSINVIRKLGDTNPR